MKIVCEDCGSENVQTREWVYVNTDDSAGGGTGDLEDNWCDNCKGYVYLIMEDEFLEQQKEDNN